MQLVQHAALLYTKLGGVLAAQSYRSMWSQLCVHVLLSTVEQ
jgi:hypothetical protein